MPGQKGALQQIQPSGGPGRRRQMALLVGEGVKGRPQHMGHRLPEGGPRQKAGHIGALHRPGAGAGPYGPKIQLFQAPDHLRQALDVLKQRVALAQAQTARRNLQQTAGVAAPLPVEPGGGGGIITGVQPQNRRHGISSVRAKVPNTPLMKETVLSSS